MNPNKNFTFPALPYAFVYSETLCEWGGYKSMLLC